MYVCMSVYVCIFMFIEILSSVPLSVRLNSSETVLILCQKKSKMEELMHTYIHTNVHKYTGIIPKIKHSFTWFQAFFFGQRISDFK